MPMSSLRLSKKLPGHEKFGESERFGFVADRNAVNDQHIVHGFAVKF